MFEAIVFFPMLSIHATKFLWTWLPYTPDATMMTSLFGRSYCVFLAILISSMSELLAMYWHTFHVFPDSLGHIMSFFIWSSFLMLLASIHEERGPCTASALPFDMWEPSILTTTCQSRCKVMYDCFVFSWSCLLSSQYISICNHQKISYNRFCYETT